MVAVGGQADVVTAANRKREYESMPRTFIVCAAFGLILIGAAAPARARELPPGFVDELLLDGARTDIQGLYCLRFAPDGRMFLSEWRRGWLRVMTYDRSSGGWTLLPEPFHRFATPDSNPESDTARRGTLRCFDFDPDFETNGVIYATYMHDEDRRGYRIVRIRQSRENPNQSDGAEEKLFVAPFHADGSQPDAHNGGGVVVGGDGKLYVSFGDGWKEDSATDLRGFAGKIVRLNRDGSIPRDNVWYSELEGDLRAIVGLGQRNPTCLSRHPGSGNVYINGFTGGAKAGMFLLQPGLHYGHGGPVEFGEPAAEWLNTKLDNGGSTWACWYPKEGPWPEEYWNNGFAVNWMPESGEIIRIGGGEQQPRKMAFASGLVYQNPQGVNIGPVAADIGPDGQLYYTVREYEEYTELRRIRYVGDRAVAFATAESEPRTSVRDETDLQTLAESGTIQQRQQAIASLTRRPGEAAHRVVEALVGELLADKLPKELQLDVLDAAERLHREDLRAKLERHRRQDAKGPLARYALALWGGDAGRGRRIFLENDGLACLKCHKFGDQGGEVGPDLTSIGAKRSREQILEGIVLPNESIEEAFVQETLATDEGKVVTGRVERETPDHLVLITPEGQRVQVAKSSIELRRRGRSAMPEDLREKISPRELRNLVEFLATTGS